MVWVIGMIDFYDRENFWPYCPYCKARVWTSNYEGHLERYHMIEMTPVEERHKE